MKSIRSELQVTSDEEKELVKKIKKSFHRLFDINGNAENITEHILNLSMDDKFERDVCYKLYISGDFIKVLLSEIRDKE